MDPDPVAETTTSDPQDDTAIMEEESGTEADDQEPLVGPIGAPSEAYYAAMKRGIQDKRSIWRKGMMAIPSTFAIIYLLGGFAMWELWFVPPFIVGCVIVDMYRACVELDDHMAALEKTIPLTAIANRVDYGTVPEWAHSSSDNYLDYIGGLNAARTQCDAAWPHILDWDRPKQARMADFVTTTKHRDDEWVRDKCAEFSRLEGGHVRESWIASVRVANIAWVAEYGECSQLLREQCRAALAIACNPTGRRTWAAIAAPYQKEAAAIDTITLAARVGAMCSVCGGRKLPMESWGCLCQPTPPPKKPKKGPTTKE